MCGPGACSGRTCLAVCMALYSACLYTPMLHSTMHNSALASAVLTAALPCRCCCTAGSKHCKLRPASTTTAAATAITLSNPTFALTSPSTARPSLLPIHGQPGHHRPHGCRLLVWGLWQYHQHQPAPEALQLWPAYWYIPDSLPGVVLGVRGRWSAPPAVQ